MAGLLGLAMLGEVSHDVFGTPSVWRIENPIEGPSWFTAVVAVAAVLFTLMAVYWGLLATERLVVARDTMLVRHLGRWKVVRVGDIRRIVYHSGSSRDPTPDYLAFETAGGRLVSAVTLFRRADQVRVYRLLLANSAARIIHDADGGLHMGRADAEAGMIPHGRTIWRRWHPSKARMTRLPTRQILERVKEK